MGTGREDVEFGREGEPEMCLKGKGWGVETGAFKVAWNRLWAALCRASPTLSWPDRSDLRCHLQAIPDTITGDKYP